MASCASSRMKVIRCIGSNMAELPMSQYKCIHETMLRMTSFEVLSIANSFPCSVQLQAQPVFSSGSPGLPCRVPCWWDIDVCMQAQAYGTQAWYRELTPRCLKGRKRLHSLIFALSRSFRSGKRIVQPKVATCMASALTLSRKACSLLSCHQISSLFQACFTEVQMQMYLT